MELHDGIAFSRNKVLQLAFSPDELFLAGTDDNSKDGKLTVWGTQTGQLATIAKTGKVPAAFLAWGEVIAPTSKTKKSSKYKLISAFAHKVGPHSPSLTLTHPHSSRSPDPLTSPAHLTPSRLRHQHPHHPPTPDHDA